MAAAGFKFPEALAKAPRCFIALSGLDIKNNAVHRAVWDEFTTGARRAERKPVLYKDVPADHLYPKCSEPRLSYDDYVPVGILKASWPTKHTEEIPSLVVFFFDLDWNDPLWEERQTECASKVEVIRASLQGRGTEIVIVLLQTTPPMPVGETSNLMSVRAAALCAACSLPRLNLFALPFTDRPQGFITRLEEAFYERAIQYYNGQIHKVKGHKELLNKQSHQLLHARHQFKVAFYTELKQDPATALKLYRTAYNHLMEIMTQGEERIMEFKLIAGFLNYKICRLCFEADEPLSAIAQFRKHMDRFNREVGTKQLAYEHAEWTSRQFSAFGDLFSEAVKRGLKAIQTQNPGLYYQQAAVFALDRKQLSHKLCLEAARRASPEQYTLPETLYYGQRPWRVDLRDDQPSDVELRQKCISAMQATEHTVQHSWQIIPLLTKAISHFKKYHCERMISYLKVLMGQEYYQVKEYEKSLVLLRGVIEAYRQEQWWKALASCLHTILRCAYILGYLQDYFTASLELISRYIPFPAEEKTRIQRNLIAVFSGHTPEPEPGVDGDALRAAKELWAGLHHSDQPLEFAIQASSHASYIECKSAFTQPIFQADSPIELKVHLRSSAPLPLTLCKLMVLFYQEEYNSWCVIDDSLTLEPSEIRTFTFSFPAAQAAMGDTLEVHAVKAVFGSGGSRSATLVWSNGVSERFSSVPSDRAWEKLEAQNPSQNSTVIQPRPSNLDISVQHSSPALTSEYYSIVIGVQNKEEGPVADLRVGVALTESLDEMQPTAELYSGMPSTPTLHQQRQSLELIAGELGGGGKYERTVFLCSHTVGTRRLNISVSYSIACSVREEWDDVVCTCQQEEGVTIQTVKPFDATYKLMNAKFKLVDSINFEEPYMLMTELHILSPWQLLIISSHFNPPKNIREVGPSKSQIEGLELGSQDRASEVHCMVASCSHGQQSNVALGTYTVQWRRQADLQSRVLTSMVTLPTVAAKHLPFTVAATLPSHGYLHEVLPVSYTVHNKGMLVEEFEAKMGASDAFMFSGRRLSRFRILPSSSHTLTYNLYPIATGMVPLPHLDLAYQRDSKAAEAIVQGSLPATIFIKPSAISRDTSKDPELFSPV